MKKIYSLLLAIIVMVTLIGSLQAQQTIGGTTKPEAYSVLKLIAQYKTGLYGGLRLPQMTTAQRDALPVTGQAEASGLTIFNLDDNCIEYWNGKEWISMCTSTTQLSFTDAGGNAVADPNQPAMPSAGGSKGPFTPHDNPDCNAANPAFTVSLVTGSEFATLNVTDVNSGTFTVDMYPNPSFTSRAAIVRITNNCSGKYQDQLFTQAGTVPTGCDVANPVPAIQGFNGTSLCAGGSVYLNLGSPAPSGTFIWTLNGTQVSTGTSYTGTTSGTYVVYRNAVGCGGSATKVIVPSSGTAAPTPVSSIRASNNGLQCTAGVTPIKLTATRVLTAGESVVWYLDGVKQTGVTGLSITTTKQGSWGAVVENGGCSSALSNEVVIGTDPNGSVPVATPNITKTGASCIGGVIAFTETTQVSGLTYTWFADGVQIGTGATLSYTVPASASAPISISVRATSATGCGVESDVALTISPNTAPSTPSIVGKSVICGAGTLLTGYPVGSYTYNWYKDSTLLTTTASQLNITQGGATYSLSLTDGNGCVSSKTSKTISATPSDLPTLSWSNTFASAYYGDIKVFGTTINYGPATGYTWTTGGGATIVSGGNGIASATVKMPSSGSSVTVSVSATNECGTTSADLVQTVAISPVCVSASNAKVSPTTTTTIKGLASNAISVTATAAGTPTYQWYSNTTNSNSGGTMISGATNSILNYINNTAGTYYVYCQVTSGCGGTPASSNVCVVTVNASPASLPVGSGSLIGKICFDVAQGNDNASIGGCGGLSYRSLQKTDFSNTTSQDPEAGTARAPFSGTQVYTFVPAAGTVTNVRFFAVDPTGIVVSVTPMSDYSGSISTGTKCKAIVVYDPTLNSRAAGLTGSNPLTVDLYAIYYDGGKDVALKISTLVKDCNCCGSVARDGKWHNWMCANLGADQSADPLTPSSALSGTYYQWGRISAAANPLTSSGADGGIIGTWNTTPAPNNAWLELSKSGADPCPTGWRVPNQDEWYDFVGSGKSHKFIKDPTGTWTGDLMSNGAYGVAFIPYAGTHVGSNGLLYDKFSAYYWTSRFQTSLYSPAGTVNLAFKAVGAAYGLSVRCIQQ